MSRKGGYKIINLKDVNLLEDTPIKVSGIYDEIEGTRKPILIENLTIDGVEQESCYCPISVNYSNFDLPIGFTTSGEIKYISIDGEDNITYKVFDIQSQLTNNADNIANLSTSVPNLEDEYQAQQETMADFSVRLNNAEENIAKLQGGN